MSAAAAPATPAVAAPVHAGLLVEFETPEALLTAAARVRDAGYTKWDCHTPFPVHGLDDAMGVKPTVLPWISFGGGLTGFLLACFLTCYTNGVELPFSLMQSDSVFLRDIVSPFLPSGYPYVVSGKPVFSIPAYVPVMFELTVLLSAIGAFLGTIALSKLPRYHHPVHGNLRFRRASSDRFFISIEATDPQYERISARLLAESLGGHLEELEG